MGYIIFQIGISYSSKTITAIEINQISLSIYPDSWVSVELFYNIYPFLN